MTATKPKVATIRLEPGTDIVGSVKFVAWYPEKENPEKPDEPYAPQWCLTGTWEGRGEARVYIAQHQIMGGNPVAQGFAVQDGQWDDGNPKFKWTGQGPFRLHKFVKDKKHFVTILPADGAAAPARADGVSGQTAGHAAVAASPAPSTDVRWEELERSYKRCVDIACTCLPAATLDHEQAYVAAIATIFIEANKRGLTVPRLAEQVAGEIRDGLDSFAVMPPQLKEEVPVGDVPEWMR